MPELPEVETIVRSLTPKLTSQELLRVTINDIKLKPPTTDLSQSKLLSINRFGKKLAFKFITPQTENIFLLIHLRMSGRLLLNENKNSDEVHILHELERSEKNFEHKVSTTIKSPMKHVRAVFEFKDYTLHFFDIRRFGTLEWIKEPPSLPVGCLDPLSEEFTWKALSSMLKSSPNQQIKSFLMRQDKISGIGNIYASEILFSAKINPSRLCRELNQKEIKALYKSTIDILQLAINHSGTTFSDYRREDGSKGGFQNLLKVYGRTGSPCYTCESIIEKVTQSQRSSFYCAKCQS